MPTSELATSTPIVPTTMRWIHCLAASADLDSTAVIFQMNACQAEKQESSTICGVTKIQLEYLEKVAKALEEAGTALHVEKGVPGVNPMDIVEAGNALRRAASALRSHAAELEGILEDED
jgi:hypothetical protein